MFKNIFKYVLTALILCTSVLFAQLDTLKFKCASGDAPPPSANLPHKTPVYGQYLRIMVIYVRFLGDNTQGNDPPFCVWKYPDAPKPTNPYTLDGTFIDGTEQSPMTPFMNRYRDYTVTDYFCEMSRGDFDVIGEEYSVTTEHEASWYHTGGNNYGFAYINQEVLQKLENETNPDFSLYNNWTYNFTSEQWEWNPGSGDNTADMIVMCYRNIPGPPWGNAWFFGQEASGISTLGVTQFFDGTYTNGVTCAMNLDNYSKTTQVWEHEIGHSWWGHHTMGIMTGYDDATYGLSPWERNDLQYITPNMISYPYMSQYADYTLGDFYATGDVVLLQLPNQSEYFWIANHQKFSKYDGISQGSKTCWEINRARQDPYCGVGTGLYIYHQNPGPSSCNFNMELDIEQADGNYNWLINRWVPYYIPGYNFCIPLFEPTINGGNPLNGRAEFYNPIMYVSNPPSCGWIGDWKQEVSDDPCSEIDNDYFVTVDKRGDGKDALNVGYDEIFSPYSNPRSNECEGGNTGLTIKLTGDDGGGNISVRIYFDDNIALQDLPPAKPKNIQTSRYELNEINGSFFPKITWDLNTEPDFVDGGQYILWKNVSTSCNPEAELNYNYLAILGPNVSEYIDQQNIMYKGPGGHGVCTNQYRSISYKIQAVDNTGLASLRSDRSIINGYINPCDPLAGKPGHENGTSNEIPNSFSVSNYPNPFNPSTEIKYALPQNSFVTINVYNILGELVAALVENEFKDAGYYTVKFDGTNLSSGIYFYTMQAGDYKASKKMVLIK